MKNVINIAILSCLLTVLLPTSVLANDDKSDMPVSFIRKPPTAPQDSSGSTNADPKTVEQSNKEKGHDIGEGQPTRNSNLEIEDAILNYNKTSNANITKSENKEVLRPAAVPEEPRKTAYPSPYQTLLDSKTATLVDDISEAVNKMKNVEGRFTQTSLSGNSLSGKFYLKRPGRIRFEYDDAPYQVISDGTTLAVFDNELSTSDRVPLATTPLNLLLKRNVDLRRDSIVKSIKDRSGEIQLSLADKSRKAEGSITVFLSKPDLRISQWIIIDATGEITKVKLYQQNYAANLKNKLFFIEEDDDLDF